MSKMKRGRGRGRGCSAKLGKSHEVSEVGSIGRCGTLVTNATAKQVWLQSVCDTHSIQHHCGWWSAVLVKEESRGICSPTNRCLLLMMRGEWYLPTPVGGRS